MSTEYTVEQYAAAIRLPVDFLTTVGVITGHTKKLVRISYVDHEAHEVAVRWQNSFNGELSLAWGDKAKPCLYGLWRISKAVEAKEVSIVGSERDCHVLWHHNVPAVSLPGEAFPGDWVRHFDGIERIYVVLSASQRRPTWLLSTPLKDRIYLVQLDDGALAPFEVYALDPQGFPAKWRNAVASGRSLAKLEAQHEAEVHEAAAAECRELATNPNILDRLKEEAQRIGLVGEERALKLLYLCLTSRVFDERPVSAVVKGVSSAGKSYIVEMVLSFFAPTAYHAMTSGSERVLIYTSETFEHRFLVFFEMDGLEVKRGAEGTEFSP